MTRYWNSTFTIKPGAPRLKRSAMKRSGRVTLRKRRESPAERKWKREVRERDSYTCQFPKCGKYSKHIDVHHKAKRSQRPDLKWDVNNGICLCREHHNWTDFNHDEAVKKGLLNTDSYERARKEQEHGKKAQNTELSVP